MAGAASSMGRSRRALVLVMLLVVAIVLLGALAQRSAGPDVALPQPGLTPGSGAVATESTTTEPAPTESAPTASTTADSPSPAAVTESLAPSPAPTATRSTRPTAAATASNGRSLSPAPTSTRSSVTPAPSTPKPTKTTAPSPSATVGVTEGYKRPDVAFIGATRCVATSEGWRLTIAWKLSGGRFIGRFYEQRTDPTNPVESWTISTTTDYAASEPPTGSFTFRTEGDVIEFWAMDGSIRIIDTIWLPDRTTTDVTGLCK